MAGFFSNVNWKHGVKTTIAAALCLLLARFLRLHQGYWACISAIVVMQSETSATLLASRDRLVGTALGALVGWAASFFWHGQLALYALVIFICMTLPQALGFKVAGRLAGVAATIVLLVPSAARYSKIALDRFIEVSLGIVVTLLVSHIIWPKTASPTKRPATP